ncbi:MAG: FKBP-type peptidyl-prolyl cis-trans isomerase [Flavobacteriales bacterium]|nr:FKBP-type peptidyl-prolyl cis-trans isomerase [Flavobacteriales bacterium]
MTSFLFLVLFLSSCNTSPEQKKPIDPAEYKQPLINANKQLVEVESQNISNYIARHGWKMTETGSGLRYMIYQNGNGEKVEVGNVIRYTVDVSLLTGKTCYTAKEKGPKEFLVGQGGVASGLEEAVLHFREGDKIRIILPSHLAFGLLGDENCIPKKATVIYDMEVILVKK